MRMSPTRGSRNVSSANNRRPCPTLPETTSQATGVNAASAARAARAATTRLATGLAAFSQAIRAAGTCLTLRANGRDRDDESGKVKLASEGFAAWARPYTAQHCSLRYAAS